MNQILLGNKKNGCLIDNENKVIEYYELLSTFEKMKHENNITSLHYQDIDYIDIGYSLVNGLRGGSATITLSIHTHNHQVYEWPLYFMNAQRLIYSQFVNELLHSGIELRDKKEILKTVKDNPTEHVGTLLFEIDKKQEELL